MRYLIAVDDCFVDAPGGMGRVAWDIALQARDRGHEVALFSAARPGIDPAKRPSEVDGIRLIRFVRPELPAWHPLRAQRTIEAGAAAVKQALGDRTWDVLHTHTPVTGIAAHLGIRRHRTVATIHSPMLLEQRINWASQGLSGRVKLLFGQGAAKRLERRTLDAADDIHVLSQFTRRTLDEMYGVGDRVTVIPHWRRAELRREYSRAEARRKLKWSEDLPTFFTVRHHGPRNGIDIGIRAVAPLAAAGKCQFMIGGDGRLRPQYEQLARDLGAAGHIHFLGRMSEEDLNLAYQAADLFLLPTRALECFGLIMLEAFAFGCPVLSSDAGAIPEVMQPILPGFIVPSGDVKTLQEKVSRYLTEDLAAPPPEEMVRYVDERYGASVVVPRLMSFLFGAHDAPGGADEQHAARGDRPGGL